MGHFDTGEEDREEEISGQREAREKAKRNERPAERRAGFHDLRSFPCSPPDEALAALVSILLDRQSAHRPRATREPQRKRGSGERRRRNAGGARLPLAVLCSSFSQYRFSAEIRELALQCLSPRPSTYGSFPRLASFSFATRPSSGTNRRAESRRSVKR